MVTPIGRIADGFEMRFGASHLGYFVCINRLASLVKDSGRVVVVSSKCHRGTPRELSRFNQLRKEYDR